MSTMTGSGGEDSENGADYEALVRLAWGGSPRAGATGPKRTLSVERIVQAAIDLADAHGLEACSMPKLAAHLGSGTMTLYRYVPSKDVLTALMRDRATPPAPTTPPRSWRTALTTYATHAVRRFAAHPWMLDVPSAGFPQTPNLLTWLEYGLQALAEAGYAPQDQLGVMLLLDGHVTATARLARENSDKNHRPSEPPVQHLRANGAYPQLVKLSSIGALRNDNYSDFGLQFGIDSIIHSASRLPTADSANKTSAQQD